MMSMNRKQPENTVCIQMDCQIILMMPHIIDDTTSNKEKHCTQPSWQRYQSQKAKTFICKHQKQLIFI